MTPAPTFDRAIEDLGNIIHLEHINLTIPDQRLATIFYVSGLGLTRDPYLMTGVTNMWINVGASQFHLPIGEAQRLRGHIGIVAPSRDALLRRLESVHGLLAGTQFDLTQHADFFAVRCPWGNSIRCHIHDPLKFEGMKLGIPYIEFPVAPGAAKPIADFYKTMLGARGTVQRGDADLHVARICVGVAQELVFRETMAAIAPYDGHHLQVYVNDFSGPHRRLLQRGLITEESDQHQYRFASIIDLAGGSECFAVEHEVRSMRHPLYGRPLVNRNAEQSNRDYRRGMDAYR